MEVFLHKIFFKRGKLRKGPVVLLIALVATGAISISVNVQKNDNSIIPTVSVIGQAENFSIVYDTDSKLICVKTDSGTFTLADTNTKTLSNKKLSPFKIVEKLVCGEGTTVNDFESLKGTKFAYFCKQDNGIVLITYDEAGNKNTYPVPTGWYKK